MSYIVGIEGLRGVGKSTIARQVAERIKADVLSLGRVRDLVRYADQGRTPELYERVTGTGTTEEALAILQAQAKAMYPYVKHIIDICRKRKINLVIEGAHVYPGLYSEDLDVECFFVAPEKDLERRIRGDDKDRKISEDVLRRNFETQEALRAIALEHNIAVIDTLSLSVAVSDVHHMLPERTQREPVA